MRPSESSASSTRGDEEINSAERVAAQLRQAILQGRIRPGEKLKDIHLAAQYGVSRNTMREAMRQLSGLVVTKLHNGTRVKVLEVEDIRDIYRVRHALEEAAISTSSAASEQQLQQLRTSLTESKQHLRGEAWDGVNTSTMYFHQAIVHMLGSQRINAFFENVLAELRLSFSLIPAEEGFHTHWVVWDEKIANLILTGRREEAAREMSLYLEDSEAQMIDLIRASHAKRP